LLKGALRESLLAPRHAILQCLDFIISRFDELVHVQLAVLERLGRALSRQLTGIALFRTVVGLVSFV
jgi:hypothetical protein